MSTIYQVNPPKPPRSAKGELLPMNDEQEGGEE